MLHVAPPASAHCRQGAQPNARSLGRGLRSCYRSVVPLPPTSPGLLEPGARPYFLWWADATVSDLQKHLRADDIDERAYWMGALLREANTRDVWQFVTPDDVREVWPHLARHLGRTRDRWAWLLGLPQLQWPPAEAHAR